MLAGCASTRPDARAIDEPSANEVREKSPVESAWDEAFRGRGEDTYQRVTATYETHLAAHPDDREARNRYGKLLYAQGRWHEAALAFEAVAAGSDHFARAAARNSILAWRRVLDQGDAAAGWFRALSEDEDVDRAALEFMWDDVVFDTLAPGRYAEVEMSEVEQRLADAADRYVAIAEPQEQALPTIQLISAHSYFRHRHFADAADRCLRIVERWPRNDLALTCGNVILNMFSASEQLGELERYSRLLWQNRGAMEHHRRLADVVEETLHEVAFQNAWQVLERAQGQRGAERRRLLLEAAQRFRRYQDEFPESPHADKALYNALAQYVSFGVKDDARVVATLIVEDYPQSPVAGQARRVLASLDR